MILKYDWAEMLPDKTSEADFWYRAPRRAPALEFSEKSCENLHFRAQILGVSSLPQNSCRDSTSHSKRVQHIHKLLLKGLRRSTYSKGYRKSSISAIFHNNALFTCILTSFNFQGKILTKKCRQSNQSRITKICSNGMRLKYDEAFTKLCWSSFQLWL